MIIIIPKKKVINYLIEEGYKNFPELLEVIPEEEIRNRLSKNTSMVIGKTEKNIKKAGCYCVSDKKIYLYEVLNNTLLSEYKSVIVHEGIHALFRRNNILNTCTGFATDKHINKRKIKGWIQSEENKLTGKKSILNKLKIIAKLPIDYYHIENFGNALNEGFTEWCTGKCCGKSLTYLPQVDIINTLEQVYGTKEILKFKDGKHKEIAEMLGMNEKQYNIFVTQMDEILLSENKMSNKDPYGHIRYFHRIIQKYGEEEAKKINNLTNEAKEFFKNKKALQIDNSVNIEIVKKEYKKYLEKHCKEISQNSEHIINNLLNNIIIPKFKNIDNPTVDDLKKMSNIKKYLIDFAARTYSNTEYVSNKINDEIMISSVKKFVNNNMNKINYLTNEQVMFLEELSNDLLYGSEKYYKSVREKLPELINFNMKIGLRTFLLRKRGRNNLQFEILEQNNKGGKNNKKNDVKIQSLTANILEKVKGKISLKSIKEAIINSKENRNKIELKNGKEER